MSEEPLPYAPLASAAPPPESANEEKVAEFAPVRRSIGGHFTHCLRHYADFRGRATRAEYWSFQFLAHGLGVLFSLLMIVPMGMLMADMLQGPIESGSMGRYIATILEAQTLERDSATASPEEKQRMESRAKDLQAASAEIEEEIKEEMREPYDRFLKDDSRKRFVFGSMILGGGLGFLWGLAVIVPSLAVSWRRLHDINLSGAFFFLIGVPYVGALALFVLTLLDSKPGANSYGPPTKYL